jgi:predicted dehydrogenase
LAQIGMKRAERPGIRLDLGLGGLAWAEQGTRRKVLARSPKEQDAWATTVLFRQIAAAFRADVEPPSSGREARETIAVIDAAYEAAAKGTRVELASRLSAAQAV